MTSGDTIGEEMIIRGPKLADKIGWSILVHTKHTIKIRWFIQSIFTESAFSLPFLLWLDLTRMRWTPKGAAFLGPEILEPNWGFLAGTMTQWRIAQLRCMMFASRSRFERDFR